MKRKLRVRLASNSGGQSPQGSPQRQPQGGQPRNQTPRQPQQSQAGGQQTPRQSAERRGFKQLWSSWSWLKRIAAIIIAFLVIFALAFPVVTFFSLKTALEEATASVGEIPQEFVAEEEVVDPAEPVDEVTEEQILDPDVSFVGEENAGTGVTESDGSVSLDPSVTFTNEQVSAQIQTTSAKKGSGGVTISYRWINAPDEGSFSLYGETWDHWVPGEEMMVDSVSGNDTGTIFVPVSNWDNVSHARIVVSSPSQGWETCGGFILVE